MYSLNSFTVKNPDKVSSRCLRAPIRNGGGPRELVGPFSFLELAHPADAVFAKRLRNHTLLIISIDCHCHHTISGIKPLTAQTSTQNQLALAGKPHHLSGALPGKNRWMFATSRRASVFPTHVGIYIYIYKICWARCASPLNLDPTTHQGIDSCVLFDHQCYRPVGRSTWRS